MMPELTSTFQSTIQYAILQAEGSGQRAVDGGNILAALYQAEQSYAVYLLQQQGVTRLDILNYIAHGISKIDDDLISTAIGEGVDDEDEFAEERAAAENAKSRSNLLPTNWSSCAKKAESTRSSGARRKSNARFRFSAAARKTIRFMSANRASAKRLWRKVWR